LLLDRCTFYGAEAEPPEWVQYRVTRKPAAVTTTVGGEAGFIALAVDGLLAGGFAGEFSDRITQLDWFVNKKLHRFNGRGKARAWILKRAAKPDWVRSWIAREFAAAAAAGWAAGGFGQSAAMTNIKAHLEKAAWHPRQPTKKEAAQDGFDLLGWHKKTRADFVRALVLELERDLPLLE
jgi:hypothetical protein